MTKLHPEKPELACIGDVYEKRNTGNKTSVNAPRIRVGEIRGSLVVAVPVNFHTGHGWEIGHWVSGLCDGSRTIRATVLDRDWRKVSP